MQKKISTATITSLSNALASIFWYKKDLKRFVRTTIISNDLLYDLDWDNPKREIVDTLMNNICENMDIYSHDLFRLIEEVCLFTDFSHLDHLENGKQLKAKAKNSVQKLKEQHNAYIVKGQDKKEKVTHIKKAANSNSFNTHLNAIKNDFISMMSLEPQEKGYKLEKIINELFKLYDLYPRASYRIDGFQIDGAFTFEATDYLLEAKCTKNPVPRTELDSFKVKIDNALENTLGLFISINGFEESVVKVHSHNRAKMLLADGGDIIAVLEKRIDLADLIRRKRRHGSETGNIYLPYNKMI